MLYTITVVSPEVEDFDLELQIESSATFADLHRLIRESCGWEGDDADPALQPATAGRTPRPSTFYVCDDRWRRERKIPEKSFEDDTMDDVELGDLLDDEGQRLQYIFDPEAQRGFLLEVSRIAYGKHIDAPLCRRHHGTAPALSDLSEPAAAAPPEKSREQLLTELNAAALLDDDDPEPTDDDLFDIEELDLEGFDFTEE
ncbi:MAG: hypothetical protein IJ700_00900 [Bacteroidaceae bacterium]|nr:hypothetical protein [Bacteroidaceae bacterium]